jgi:hypothetical protein
MLIFTVAEYLYELLQNGIMTAMTPLCESSGVVVVTIYVSIVFVVAILGTEYSWTCGASEMLNMVFSI